MILPQHRGPGAQRGPRRVLCQKMTVQSCVQTGKARRNGASNWVKIFVIISAWKVLQLFLKLPFYSMT